VRQKSLINELNSLPRAEDTIARREAKSIEDNIINNFNCLKKFIESSLNAQSQKVKEILEIITNNPGPNVFPWSMVNVQTYFQRNDFNKLMHTVPEFLYKVRKVIEANYAQTREDSTGFG
jgi:hypothetical protein